MENFARKAIIIMFSSLYLTLIMHGQITSPDQIPGNVDSTELRNLSGVIMKETGYATEECCLLTGSVVLNRIASPNWKGDNVEEVVMAKESGYWQYAYETRRNFKSIETTPRVQAIAKYLLIYGPICPSNVMYQGMDYNGSGLYKEFDIPGQKRTEKFCFE